ncbi:hypothetical protein LTR29_006548 [Friedmanniomyces endolithicus]|nr:hypothetical protein LTR29_006548 [Friedmanniomyces endolithicus]
MDNLRAQRRLRSNTQSTSPTILVPETPLQAATANQPTATPHRANSTRSRSRPAHATERNELQHLRARRAVLTTTLEESTAHVSRLQLRNRLQNQEILRERAVAARATAERNEAVAGREREVAVAVAEARGLAEGRGRAVWKLGVLLGGLVVGVVVYGGWCYVNQASFRYIRGVEERRYGL